MDQLGVRESPTWQDAIALLCEISELHDVKCTSLDLEDQEVILNCWKLIAETLSGQKDTQSIENDLYQLRDRHVVPENSGNLRLPMETYILDRIGLAEKFRDVPQIQDSLISRIEGVWTSMEAAGVQRFSEIVEVRVLEKSNPEMDIDLSKRVSDRQALLRRVIEAEIHSTDDLNSILATLRISEVDDLVIEYVFTDDFHDITYRSEPECANAHYSTDENTLYFIRQNGQIPISSMAREIALALVPDINPGHIAAGVKEVLSVENHNQASLALDELGYPPLDSRNPDFSLEHKELSEIGEDAMEERSADASCYASPTLENNTSMTPEAVSTSHDKPDDSMTVINESLSESASSDFAEVIESSKIETGETVRRKSKKSEVDKQTKKEVVRTYMRSTTNNDSQSNSSDSSHRREKINRAGVNKVLHYESNAGRNPIEKSHENEGYDVESLDTHGNVERYIEIKSMSGTWRDSWASISKPQFKFGQQKLEKYWLYTVENALDEKSNIIRIQNPSERVTDFMFDDGWLDLAERD